MSSASGSLVVVVVVGGSSSGTGSGMGVRFTYITHSNKIVGEPPDSLRDMKTRDGRRSRRVPVANGVRGHSYSARPPEGRMLSFAIGLRSNYYCVAVSLATAVLLFLLRLLFCCFFLRLLLVQVQRLVLLPL